MFVEPHGRFARNTKTRDLGKSPSAIGSAEPSPGLKLRFTRRRLHVPTLRVMPKPRDTKVARKVTKELLARNNPLDASISLAPGCDKYFVYLRETFVSRRAAETPEGWRLRERQRPSSLESSDARADSNRPSGRFRGGAGFRGSREAPVRLEMPLHEHKTFSCGIKRCCDAASYSPVMPHHI